MKITVIGTGYVGLVSGTCFAEMGNKVYCADVDERKITNLNNGVIPIYEPGLEEMVKKNIAEGSLFFQTDSQSAVEDSDIVFIAVGTPTGEDGGADLRYVLSAAESIGKYMKRDMVVVVKSTVPVGSNEKVRGCVLGELQKRGVDYKVYNVSNPEFLKEGTAVEDCMKPDRIVIGTDSGYAESVMRALYEPFFLQQDKMIFMDIHSAEMTKYAANAMLASRISFMNEIAQICERVGADVGKVRKGIGADSRIGYSFLYAGVGYGGSCFPKDVKALLTTAKDAGLTPDLLIAVEAVNERQKYVLVEKILAEYGEDLAERTFALWGLAFKPNTDDMREAPAIVIANELTKRGAKIKAYDPKAREQAEEYYLRGNKNIIYAKSKYDALDGADALILVTEWQTFRSPDFDEVLCRLKSPVIFDGRNQYKPSLMKDLGIKYFSIGRKGGE
jgi:UDPglucose 6-dehydrogenase